MYSLSTSIELPIAHRLEAAFSGLCVGTVGVDDKPSTGQPIYHGHNYHVTFDILTNLLNNEDMVVDFKKIKEIIHNIFDKYDHSLILKKGDPLLEFYKDNSENSRLFIWEKNPTAEYMCYYWYHEIFNELLKIIPDLNLKITVEETSHNKVTYWE